MTSRAQPDQLLSFIPALILLVVAASYVWRWTQEPITAWRGGGMGMYSEINDGTGRTVKVFVFRQDWEEVPKSLLNDARVSTVVLNQTVLKINHFAAYLSCSPSLLERYPGVRRVRVEAWEMTFDPQAYRVSAVKRQQAERETC